MRCFSATSPSPSSSPVQHPAVPGSGTGRVGHHEVTDVANRDAPRAPAVDPDGATHRTDLDAARIVRDHHVAAHATNPERSRPVLDGHVARHVIDPETSRAVLDDHRGHAAKAHAAGPVTQVHVADTRDLDTARAVVHTQVHVGGHLHDQIDARVPVPTEPAAGAIARVVGVERASVQRHVEGIQPLLIGCAQGGVYADVVDPAPSRDDQLAGADLQPQALTRALREYHLSAQLAVVLGGESRGGHRGRAEHRCRPDRPLRHVVLPLFHGCCVD